MPPRYAPWAHRYKLNTGIGWLMKYAENAILCPEGARVCAAIRTELASWKPEELEYFLEIALRTPTGSS